MKILQLVALALYVTAGPMPSLDETAEVVPQEAVDYINNIQSLWVCSKEWVGSMTVGQAKGLASSLKSEDPAPEYRSGFLENFNAPASFDSRTQWPNCVSDIRDQQTCSSCWAFAAAEVFGDRICMWSGGQYKYVLSPQYLLDCESHSLGCNGGGYQQEAWKFLYNKGIPLDSCVPYLNYVERCPGYCAGGRSIYNMKVSRWYVIQGENNIKNNIMNGGPIEVMMTTYQDLYCYTSGVYSHTWGNQLTNHSVKMIGWGVSDNQNYWICANSWGTGWGMQGYFNIAFGNCGIENNGIAGDPII